MKSNSCQPNNLIYSTFTIQNQLHSMNSLAYFLTYRFLFFLKFRCFFFVLFLLALFCFSIFLFFFVNSMNHEKCTHFNRWRFIKTYCDAIKPFFSGEYLFFISCMCFGDLKPHIKMHHEKKKKERMKWFNEISQCSDFNSYLKCTLNYHRTKHARKNKTETFEIYRQSIAIVIVVSCFSFFEVFIGSWWEISRIFNKIFQ